MMTIQSVLLRSSVFVLFACSSDAETVSAAKPDAGSPALDSGNPPAFDSGVNKPDTGGPGPVSDSGVSDAGTDSGSLVDSGAVTVATWTQVHAELKAACVPCHSTLGSGSHKVAQTDAALAYADAKKPSNVCAGMTVGACSAKRIRNGTMPAAGLPAATKTRIADLMDTWIAGGQVGP
jgi:hypothetical protein